MSPSPLVLGEWLQPGTHLDLVGAFKPDTREVDDRAIRHRNPHRHAVELAIQTEAAALQFDKRNPRIRPASLFETIGPGKCTGCHRHAPQSEWWYDDPHFRSADPFFEQAPKNVEIARLYGIRPRDMARGDNLTLSSLTATVHLGAHADAPSHYGAEAPSIDQRPLAPYLGRCQLIRVDAGPGEALLQHVGEEVTKLALFAAGDRGPEVVPRRDSGFDFLAQPGLRLGRLDRYLELGLLVFLDAEGAAGPIAVHVDAVDLAFLE